MDKPFLSERALRQFKAVQLEAGADLLNGLDAFWRGIGMSTKALRDHDALELMPLFERYAERVFEAEAREWLACFSDPDAYAGHICLLPLTVATRIAPPTGTEIVPKNVLSTDWKDIYRAAKAHIVESGGKSTGLGHLSGDWENYLDHSFSRRFLKGRITTMAPDTDSAARKFRVIFWLKYLFYLRLFANKQLFIQRICMHLSVQLRAWRAQAYRQMADAVPPPADDPLPPLPGAVVPEIAGGESAAPTARRRRGPKPDHDTAARIADVVARIAPNGDWRSNLYEICEALDEEHIPVPRTWRRNRKYTEWIDCDDRDLIVKAIAYRLGQARQRKKNSPETFS